jgi:hypothetical protein
VISRADVVASADNRREFWRVLASASKKAFSMPAIALALTSASDSSSTTSDDTSLDELAEFVLCNAGDRLCREQGEPVGGADVRNPHVLM